MKIYTRKGDGGTTQLFGGPRVPKHSLRIECYGTVDELNSWIGFVGDVLPQDQDKRILRRIQQQLFVIGSLLATAPGKEMSGMPQLAETDVEALENQIDQWSASLPPLQLFVLPGGHLSNSAAHVARCVCRRAERLVVALHEQEPLPPLIIKYLNRLSDLLFILARKCSHDSGSAELFWQGRKA
ncbi:MAG: cob(I)yrinic acid a,c-diamide adenosyltransferase [Chitinophagales bacterium]|nr:cob(I)yrinic acid a,c-diamide adenosyltransferase [Chitinophagales bacterium]MDW8427464.1 cob(I)yrinic acid a,c-diamide adenosyltransferase [Chitinophagales bacterium]